MRKWLMRFHLVGYKFYRVYEKKSVNLIAFYGNIKLIIGGDFLWAERKENH